MKRRKLPQLSRSELDLMKIIWNRGESSVREVHDELTKQTDVAYTTTKTTMDRMVAKKLLRRRRMHGVFVYAPLVSRAKGLAGMVREFADRILEGDRASVVALFAESGTLSEDELAELADLVEGGDRS